MTDKQWEDTIGDELGEFKVPCFCPKGGQYDDGTVCDKCDGSEWVLPPKLIDFISQAVKKERERILDELPKMWAEHRAEVSHAMEYGTKKNIPHFFVWLKEIRKDFPKE